MLKKLCLGVSALLIAFFLVAFFMIQKATSELKTQLSQHQLFFDDIQLSLSLKPSVELSNVRYDINQVRSFFSEKVSIQLDPVSLLREKKKIDNIHFQQGKLLDKQTALLSFPQGNLTGEVVVQQNKVLFDTVELQLQFDKPILLNTKQISLSIGKGEIQKIATNDYQFLWDQVTLNKQFFGLVKGKITLADQWSFTAETHYDKQYAPAKLSLQVGEADRNNGQRQGKLQTEKLPLGLFLTALNLPTLLTGEADLFSHFSLKNNQITTGSLEANIQNAQLNGLNLLELISPYFKLNYDQAQLEEGKMRTTFEALTGQLAWRDGQLTINHLKFAHRLLHGEGAGQVDLNNMKCDINVMLSIKNKAYLTLPIQFFDDCNKPQYRIDWNDNLKQQLKSFLKQKFK